MAEVEALKVRADKLLALHQPGNPVVLPTVWDAWSAKLAVDAGFEALTVGSHPLADSIGKPDNEGMVFDDVLTRVAQITAAVDVPLSVDIESGYAEPPARLIEELLSVGAVGLNIEDTVHSEGRRLRSAEEHAELVGALRAAADAGADVLYPVGVHPPEVMRRLTSELPLPVNAIAQPDKADPASYGPLGVARISFGPFWQAALAERSKEILSRWA